MSADAAAPSKNPRSGHHGRQGMSRRSAPGTPPGLLVSHPEALAPVITVMAFGPGGIEEKRVAGPDEARAFVGEHRVAWIDVVGLADIRLIQRLGELFELHRLALEDAVNVHQRPKVEQYDDSLFLVARMPDFKGPLDTEQVSFFLGANYVLSFQERPGDCFDPVRSRLRSPQSRIREQGADYLLYALLDSVVDSYFPALEIYGERLATLEGKVLREPTPDHIREIHQMKRELMILRRAVWPKRDLLSTLLRETPANISERTVPYLRDCYDHTIQLMEIIETYRETASSLVDIYLSSVSTRMNEVMKVLTVIATIFIPLSFISGLYGMNFDTQISPFNMPELKWRFGYPLTLAVMASVAGFMLYYFYRKRWIWDGRPRRRRRK